MSMCGRESERESGNKSAHSRGRIVRKNYANEYLHRLTLLNTVEYIL